MNTTEMAKIVQAILDRQPHPLDVECDGCGKSTHDGSTLEQVIEDAAFNHTTRCGLLGVRVLPILSAYELGGALDLEPITEHEQKWRAEQKPATQAEPSIDWGITAPSPKITEH